MRERRSMEKLRKLSQHFLKIKDSEYRRYLIQTTKFTHRMNAIIGQRGIGKTTTLVQLLLDHAEGDRFDKRILYIQADHFQVGSSSLYEIAEQFQAYGGKWLAFDEIHKYPDWSGELKSIYDTFPDLSVYASGSSALKIHQGTHDLSRRVISHKMQGLSIREYLELIHSVKLSTYSLQDLLKNHEKICDNILEILEKKNLKILPEFSRYLKVGYYPYYHEINDETYYKITLEQNLHTTIDSDLAAIHPHLNANSINKIKKFLIYIASSVPFTPQWQKIKSLLDIGDVRTLKNYFSHLEDAALIRTVKTATSKFHQVKTYEKVYPDNPNQLHAICSNSPEKGTIREIFFLNMLSVAHKLRLPLNGDFIVDDLYLFEIGGRKKSFRQIKGLQKSFVVCDEIEHGIDAKIPLWLFGFLY